MLRRQLQKQLRNNINNKLITLLKLYNYPKRVREKPYSYTYRRVSIRNVLLSLQVVRRPQGLHWQLQQLLPAAAAILIF
jgi:hypothetical protein